VYAVSKSWGLGLFHSYGQLLRIYPALIVLASDTDNIRARRQRSDKMPEFISIEDSGGWLSIDHDDSTGLGRSLDFNDAPMLKN
jgi:hypothetical protein